MTEPAIKVQPKPVEPAPQPALPPTARELRRQRARRLALRFAIGVGVPTLIAIVYSGFLAAPQYDSVAVIAIESHEAHSEAASGRDSNAGNQRDARLLREQIKSRAMLAALEGFAAHYRGGDWLAGLDDDAGTEETFDYYRDKVVVTQEPQSNVLHVRVRAFSAAEAQRFAQAIVAASEAWVDELSAMAAAELITPAEQEVARARDRLVAARTAAEPTDLTVADRSLEAAVEALQEARLDAAAAQRRLIVVAPPSLATDPSRPRPAWDIATVLVTSAVLVAVLSLLGAAIREHANF